MVKAEKIDTIYMRRYTDKFAEIFDDDKVYILQDAIDFAYETFLGLEAIFSSPDKVRRCYSLIACWYIAERSPEYCIGVMSNGSGLLRGKSIGGARVDFWHEVSRNNELLKNLETNVFGKMALMMIDSSLGRTAWTRRKM